MNRNHRIPIARSYNMKKQIPFTKGAYMQHYPYLKKILWIITILFLFFLLTIPTPCVGEAKHLLRIGTGGTTGVYYPVGKLIAQGLTEPVEGKKALEAGVQGVPGHIGVAQNSAGSIENVRTVASGEIELGIVQADVAAWAFRSEHVFAGDKSARGVRAVASLYPEKFQIVTRRDANIRNVLDLRGKRISVDEIGSGTLSVMRIVLEAHGLSEKDLSPVYLKPVFTHDKMVKGDLQGFVMMAGAPMEAVTQLYDIGISLVPIAPEMALRISSRFPYLIPGKIPAGVYSGIPDTPTVQVHALLVVSATMHEDLVYQATASLWSERTLSLLKRGHPQGKSITPQTALVGISIPLHPGAERFYREHRMFKKGTPSP